MAKDKFVYVNYIRTTPEILWRALREPEFTRLYWSGVTQVSDWKAGSPWKMVFADGTVGDVGEIVEIDPPKRLVIRWRNEFRPELKAEGDSLCTIELEDVQGAVKLTVRHEIDVPKSKFIEAVSGGWPSILASLKTLLETNEPLAMAKGGCKSAA